MKKPVKILISVIYYIFVVIIVFVLAIILPEENKNSLVENCIKDSINSENYEQIVALFCPYYNETPICSINESNKIIRIYETVTNDEIYDTENYYMKKSLVGFIFNSDEYNYQDLTDSNGDSYNNTRLQISDDNNNTYDEIELESANFVYLDKYGMIQFEIDEFDFKQSNLSAISNISFYQNDNSKYLTISNLNLNFSTDFFNDVEEFNYLYNEQLYDIPLNFSGSINKSDSSSILSVGACISFQSTVQVLITISSDKLFEVSLDGTILNANYGTTTYTISSDSSVVITAKEETNLEYISFTYDGTLSYIYTFSDNIDTSSYKYVYKYEDSLTSLGKTYDQVEVETNYNNWLETYTFNTTNYNEIVSPASTRAMWQVILIIIALLLVGDTLIGSRMIIRFVKWIIKKFKKKNPNDKTTEVTPAFNDYEVNVECKIIVPENYENEIHIVYKLKDKDMTMTFDLDKKNNYTMSNRYRNGVYELKEISIPNLKLIEKKNILNVKGYRYKLELKAASIDE